MNHVMAAGLLHTVARAADMVRLLADTAAAALLAPSAPDRTERPADLDEYAMRFTDGLAFPDSPPALRVVR